MDIVDEMLVIDDGCTDDSPKVARDLGATIIELGACIGVGAALRALNHFLNEVDPSQEWSDLRETPTPDGNILWLCPEHREAYIAKPLDLDSLPLT